MEFLDPKQKRAHEIKLYIGYALMTVLILMSTLLIAFFSYGFNFDAKTKTVVQNGLLFVDSHPESARVSLNGQDKGETDVRLVLPAGDYDVRLTRDGYRNWQHDINLEGGNIERLVYPFLFPEKLNPTDVDLFAAKPSFASQSPDRRWIVMKQAAQINDFQVVDLNAENPEPVIVTLPPTVINQTGPNHVFTEIEWSTDNRHMLVKHSFDGGSEFIVFDRENAATAVNVNTTFKRPITDVRLRDKKFDRYYIHDSTSGDLVSAELSNAAVTTVASKVISYQPHGNNMILYASNSSKQKDNVEIRIIEGDKQYTLRELPKSSKYLLDLAEFDGNWYFVAGSSDDKKVYIYVDPLKDLKRENQRAPQPSALLRLNKTIDFLSFSANTRFIAIQAGSSFAVYDAETVRQFKYDVQLDLPVGYEITWMDGHRLQAVSKGKMVVFDFDGTNKQTLVDMYDSFYPFFDRDYDKLFTISPSVTVKDKSALVVTPMRTTVDTN